MDSKPEAGLTMWSFTSREKQYMDGFSQYIMRGYTTSDICIYLQNIIKKDMAATQDADMLDHDHEAFCWSIKVFTTQLPIDICVSRNKETRHEKDKDLQGIWVSKILTKVLHKMDAAPLTSANKEAMFNTHSRAKFLTMVSQDRKVPRKLLPILARLTEPGRTTPAVRPSVESITRRKARWHRRFQELLATRPAIDATPTGPSSSNPNFKEIRQENGTTLIVIEDSDDEDQHNPGSQKHRAIKETNGGDGHAGKIKSERMGKRQQQQEGKVDPLQRLQPTPDLPSDSSDDEDDRDEGDHPLDKQDPTPYPSTSDESDDESSSNSSNDEEVQGKDNKDDHDSESLLTSSSETEDPINDEEDEDDAPKDTNADEGQKDDRLLQDGAIPVSQVRRDLDAEWHKKTKNKKAAPRLEDLVEVTTTYLANHMDSPQLWETETAGMWAWTRETMQMFHPQPNRCKQGIRKESTFFMRFKDKVKDMFIKALNQRLQDMKEKKTQAPQHREQHSNARQRQPHETSAASLTTTDVRQVELDDITQRLAEKQKEMTKVKEQYEKKLRDLKKKTQEFLRKDFPSRTIKERKEDAKHHSHPRVQHEVNHATHNRSSGNHTGKLDKDQKQSRISFTRHDRQGPPQGKESQDNREQDVHMRQMFVRDTQYLTNGLPPEYKEMGKHGVKAMEKTLGSKFDTLEANADRRLKLPPGTECHLHRGGATGAFTLTFTSVTNARKFWMEKQQFFRWHYGRPTEVIIQWKRPIKNAPRRFLDRTPSGYMDINSSSNAVTRIRSKVVMPTPQRNTVHNRTASTRQRVHTPRRYTINERGTSTRQCAGSTPSH